MTKKYSISWENDDPVSFEVDGIAYENLDQVPDEVDRGKLEAMLDTSLEQKFEKEFEDFDKDFDREFEANKKNSVNVEKLILAIFSGVAMLMFLIAGLSSFSAIQKMSKEESASGRVTDMVVQPEVVNLQNNIVRNYYYPVVEFVASDGHRRSVQMAEGSQSPFYEVGDDVTVQYDPAHPLEARIKSFGSDALLWILPGITGIIGLGFLVAVIAVRRFMPLEE